MNQHRPSPPSSRHGWLATLATLIALAFVLPVIPYGFAGEQGPIVVPNPGAQLWRDARQATQGNSQAQGVDSGVLIDSEGQAWREYRLKKLVPYGAIVLGGMLGLLLLYLVVRGRIRVEEGLSGHKLRRYTSPEMGVHWLLAITFVALALTGLILLYGRWVLIPLLGPEGFSATASLSKLVHNYSGLAFGVILVVAFFMYLKDSLFKLKVDLVWFLRVGGYLGGGEPKSYKVNAGQKAWYWVAMLGGMVLVASGLILDFPNFQQGRQLMHDAHLFHTVAAVAVIAFFFVHLYLATVGVEGAFGSMLNGYVDENWAKQHHRLWYQEVKGQAGENAKGPPAGD